MSTNNKTTSSLSHTLFDILKNKELSNNPSIGNIIIKTIF